MLGLVIVLLGVVCVSAAVPSNSVVIDQMMGKVRSLLRREGDWELTTPQIVGIAVGGTAFVALAGWLIYRYKTWVPKTRPARAKAESGPSSPSSADERQKLIVAKS